MLSNLVEMCLILNPTWEIKPKGVCVGMCVCMCWYVCVWSDVDKDKTMGEAFMHPQ